MEDDKNIDESWKDEIFKDKDISDPLGASSEPKSEERPGTAEGYEVNFLTYITSLTFQSMIFLGDIPNPLTNKTEKNLTQAKFLIDTLTVIKEKTKGNLTSEEDNMINGALYELQMRFVELSSQKEEA